MIVFLDTTVLVQDWGLQSSPARALLTASSLSQLRVYIPEVVIREATRRWGVHHEELARRARELSRLDPSVSIDGLSETRQEAERRFEDRIRARCHEDQVMIPALPRVDHEALLTRALARTSPFDGKGRGYQDSLIWFTVLEVLASEEGSSAAFVSANTSDFSNRAEPLALAATLEEDARSLGANVTYFTDLAGFVQEHITPATEVEDTLSTRLDSDEVFRQGIAGSMAELALDEPRQMDGDFNPVARHDVVPAAIEYDFLLSDPRDVRVLTAWPSGEDHFAVSLGASGDVAFSLQIKPDEVRLLPEEELDAVLSRPDGSTTVDIAAPVFMIFDATWSSAQGTLDDIAFAWLSGPLSNEGA